MRTETGRPYNILVGHLVGVISAFMAAGWRRNDLLSAYWRAVVTAALREKALQEEEKGRLWAVDGQLPTSELLSAISAAIGDSLTQDLHAT